MAKQNKMLGMWNHSKAKGTVGFFGQNTQSNSQTKGPLTIFNAVAYISALSISRLSASSPPLRVI